MTDQSDSTGGTGTTPEIEEVEGRPKGWDQEPDFQRLNRELLELLNELRVTLPGVTVLFSFLLVLAFNDRFARLTSFEHAVYYATFLSTALSAVFLMAPSVHLRVMWRRYGKDRILRMANKLAILGTTLLAFGIGGAVFLVTDILFGIPAAVTVAAIGLLGVVGLWFLLPFAGRRG